MFASKTLLEHLLRGVLGIGAVALAALLAATHPLVALAMVPVALVALRGCPMCWTIGLIETVRRRFRHPCVGQLRRSSSRGR